MTQGTGSLEIIGCFVAVAGSPHPGTGMGSSIRMTVFAPFLKISDEKVKAGVATRTTVKGACVTFLAIGQVGPGLWSMQLRVCKGNGVRLGRTICVAPG